MTTEDSRRPSATRRAGCPSITSLPSLPGTEYWSRRLLGREPPGYTRGPPLSSASDPYCSSQGGAAVPLYPHPPHPRPVGSFPASEEEASSSSAPAAFVSPVPSPPAAPSGDCSRSVPDSGCILRNRRRYGSSLTELLSHSCCEAPGKASALPGLCPPSPPASSPVAGPLALPASPVTLLSLYPLLC